MSGDAPTTDEIVINTAALEPLFPPWEEPNKHRVRSSTPGQSPEIKTYRRRSPVKLVNPLREAVREWRDLGYPGASATTQNLLSYWFERPHRIPDGNTGEIEFRYYFCQREAIETFIYLNEVRQIRTLSGMLTDFGGPTGELEASGINPEDELWARYAFKLATGAGKTKCMSLAIVWSYFHALREGSDMARHFVVVAPNLTVFERLKEDFRPEGGGPDIFMRDPLVPPEWKGDWSCSVVLQDEVSGASTGGVLYLTNIHRLFDPREGRSREAETFGWAGPSVSKSKSIDTGEELRDRITAHKRVLLLNDEAHHVWDSGSAWNQAIRSIHDTLRKRGGDGIVAQLDFSATPKNDKGIVFPHVVCDTPLGEAVDAGIIKTPVIGKSRQIIEQPHDDAAYRFEAHLRVGYERWRRSRDEWSKSGRKPLLFVMCENTEAADQITVRLNSDAVFKELNGKTINLHTNLKGKVKKQKIDGRTVDVFVEDEKAISDDDLKALRRISRDLDRNESHYTCIVSVLMLREGWDVRNVTTIVPLRPLTAQSNILPEQTLGRGLRRMTPPGQANELVTVVEHPSFINLYEQELEQQGLPIAVEEIEKVPATSVTIFPDETKNFDHLDIKLPGLTAAHEIQPKLEGLTIEDVREAFRPYNALPLGKVATTDIEYEGRALITDELVESMKISLPLLQNGITAISFFTRELEIACRIQSAHRVLAPLLQIFLGEILFGRKISLVDQGLTSRLSDQDVREHIRAVFVPLIRKRTVTTEKRRVRVAAQSLRTWKPYQATFSENRPVEKADKTLFNLVPCNRSLEVATTKFLDKAPDVSAFAKNAGPQALRIDYLTAEHRLAFYTPDFFARDSEEAYFLIETKGRQDRDVPRKGSAAVEWCKAASKSGKRWSYVFVPQAIMEGLTSNRLSDLTRACAPALQNLLSETTGAPELPLFGEQAKEKAQEFYSEATLAKLTPRERKAAEDAAELYRYFERKAVSSNFAPAFSTLLGSFDDAAKTLIMNLLQGSVPTARPDQENWFDPYLGDVEQKNRDRYLQMGKNLKRGLVYGNPRSVIGLLCSCLDYALNDNTKIDGVFVAVRGAFRFTGARNLLSRLTAVNEFRNTYIAHHQKDLTDKIVAERHLKQWVETVALLRI